MSKTFSLTIVSNDDEQPFESDAPHRSIFRLINYLKSCVGGARNGAVTMTARNSAVAAAGTVTLATVSVADTVTVDGTVFTAVASGATGPQFNQGGTDAVDAASLVTAINAHATVGQVVIAAITTGAIVGLTAKNPGVSGNSITLASSNGSRLAVSAAKLTGGSETAISYAF